MTTLMIDNYDSFTWNVYQYLTDLGADVEVVRNDQVTVEWCLARKPRNVVISPGPGYPKDAGISMDVIRAFAGKVPILGVCLGEQAMYEVFGGTVRHAGEIVHGKTSLISHDGRGLYKSVSQGIQATRYHSLAGDPKTLPDCLEITSSTASGIVMGVRHKTFVLEGVQYHPESIASEEGKKMFANFLMWEGGTWDTLVIKEEYVRKEALSSGPGASGDIGRRGDIYSGISLADASKINSTNGAATDTPAKKPTILEQINAQRMMDVAAVQSLPGRTEFHLARSIALGAAPPLIHFHERLLRAANPVAVCAEVKRASPSKGAFDLSVHAPTQALTYARGGAAVISVLTEPKWFQGSLEDMLEVRRALDVLPDRPAVLRKDFILNRYQVIEARLYGADTVLLIVASFTHEYGGDEQLASLVTFSRSLGMEPLVEVANSAEMERAVKVGARVIGVNNRDLHTFNVDPARTTSLAKMVPEGVVLIALSGIFGREDVQRNVDGGAKAVLVGEALMKSSDKFALLRELQLLPAVKGQSLTIEPPFVKVCGVVRAEDAIHIAKSGADMIGLIFAKSPRQVTAEHAGGVIRAVRDVVGVPTDVSQGLTLPSSSGFATSRLAWLRSTTKSLVEHRQNLGRPLFVGVFMDQPISYINACVREAGLDLVQLHGNEPSWTASFISVPVIKVIHVPAAGESASKDDTANEVRRRISDAVGSMPQLSNIAAVLLDTSVKGSAAGGSGVSFDWEVAKLAFEEHVGSSGPPLLLAGGLTPTNVGEAGKISGAWGVDVASGVESGVGVKDYGKVGAFIDGAKSSK
ncbi:indole-3-glycerol phosphate synthase-domain-containing protein [Cladochytrium replicatum]|nr:indole-3-glycerol phosphate synthase-domain-containing protein [Cladochytrium replicatum]